MKFVCEQCGTQLPIDRDVDDDRNFERVLDRHRSQDCPRSFIVEDAAPRAPGRF